MDFLVVVNVVDEFDKSVDLEDSSDDKDGDKGVIFLNFDGE